jgi:ligand-binding sensor domain-containing protein
MMCAGIRIDIVAQPDYNSTSFTTVNGLSNNEISDICKDKTGFLWIATREGVSRFDGYEFRNYYSNPVHDSVSLGYFAVDKLLCDRLNNLLALSTFYPIARYDRTLDQFEPYKVNGRTDERIHDMAFDGQEKLWLLGYDSLYQSKGIDEKFTAFWFINEQGKRIGLALGTVFSIDNKNNIWIFEKIVGKGIRIFRGIPAGERTYTLKYVQMIDLSANPNFAHGIYCHTQVHISDSGTIWFGSAYGLFRSSPDHVFFHRFRGAVDPGCFIGRSEFMWIDADSGLYIIQPEKQKYLHFKASNGSHYTKAYVEPSGTIWSSGLTSESTGTGLKRDCPVPEYFQHYLTDSDKKQGLNLVFPIAQDIFGNLWVGLKGKPWLIKISPDQSITKVKYFQGQPGKDFPQARSLLADSTGLWVGCTQGKLFCYSYGTGRFEERFSPKPNLNPGYLLNLQKCGDTIYFIGETGLYAYHIIQKDLIAFRPFPLDLFASTMICDSKGQFWAGYNHTVLSQLDRGLKEIRRDSFGIRSDIVENICPGRHDDLWVALQGGGLGHYDLKTKKTTTYTTKEGLPNNTLWSLVMDRYGLIWIATSNGISCFNPTTERFKNFSIEEGLSVYDFNGDSYFASPKGEIIFGGVGGMVRFDPEKVMQAVGKPYPLVITDLSVSGYPVYGQKVIYEADTMYLKKGDNNFQVSFACLDLQDGQHVKYRYRLIGLSELWRETDQKNRKVAFYNLKPGDYLLEVEANGKNGDWKSRANLTLVIPFRVHETIWFQIMVAVTIALLIVSLIILRFRQVRMKSQHQLDTLRLEALRTQMNPHFIFNSLNSINMFISTNDKLAANSYIADFSRLIRSFLTNLSGDFIPIEDEISLIKNYLDLEKLRFNEQFNYSLELEPSLIGNGYSILPGIIQPFVENAIWHGFGGLQDRSGHLQIRIFMENSRSMKCIIDDNGIGREKAMRNRSGIEGRKSRGIGIVQERLQLINRTKRTHYRVTTENLCADRENTGTRVIIDLPFLFVEK